MQRNQSFPFSCASTALLFLCFFFLESLVSTDMLPTTSKSHSAVREGQFSPLSTTPDPILIREKTGLGWGKVMNHYLDLQTKVSEEFESDTGQRVMTDKVLLIAPNSPYFQARAINCTHAHTQLLVC
jgi:hypothetical protein